MNRKIIIDTDPGHDDVMAIMLAVKSGFFDILAITTVCGNSTIENTTRNASYTLGLLGAKNIPIYSGAKAPIKRRLIQAVVHGKSGLDGVDPKNKPSITKNAVEKIISLVQENPHKITIVTLGPLTNVAQAIIEQPGVMKFVAEIVIMGGAIKVPGNKNRVAEFNMFVDPEAADIVFNFPVKKTLIPLDACNHVQLNLDDFKRITHPKLKNPLLNMIKPYITNIAQNEGVKAALMYDPLTIYYLINTNSSKTYECNIEIETKGKLTRGMTVPDFRLIKDNKPNVTIVEHIDSNSFRNYFINTLNKLSN